MPSVGQHKDAVAKFLVTARLREGVENLMVAYFNVSSSSGMKFVLKVLMLLVSNLWRWLCGLGVLM
jgi:hypothetical protein